MSEEQAWHAELPFGALLRAARQAYAAEIVAALTEAGCDDVPRNGAYVIGAIARGGAPLSLIIQGLGVSKQAAGQLVDTLVVRGYVTRAPDPEDRRRLTLALTERGQAAAAAIRSAADDVDAYLERRVGREYVEHTRATLAALVDAGREERASEEHRHG
jgi:DNA-binding MarR family transcriptional regulator